VSEPADVLIAEPVSADQAAEIAAAFGSIGLTAALRVVSTKRSLADLAWLVLAAIPLQPFFNHLAEDLADDAHQRLSTFVSRVLRRPAAVNPPKPVLVLQDAITGVQVVLEPDLPADSYRQLLSLDLARVRHGPLHYDLQRRRWRSELDEAPSTTNPP
jgi:hypothetical protein